MMKLAKKLLWTPLIMILFVSMTMVNTTMASPETCIYVDPPEYTETPDGSLLITINVAEAPPTFAWTFSLSWDPDLLELVYIMEGDFLKRGATYETSFVYDGGSLGEANLEGQILIGCSLLGNVTVTEDWASGDGTLCTLGFIVQDEGSCVLDLFDTLLYGEPLVWNEEKQAYYPTPTEYPSVDGSVTATLFYNAALSYWKIKVNGRLGLLSWLLELLGWYRWAGLFAPRTEVGTENLLEAYVRNRGSFDVDVQVSFEIRDAAGYWIATVESDIELLPVGETTTLSAHWTANSPGTYYITAYGFYSAPPYVPNPLYPHPLYNPYGLIPDGFSRTFRLEVESV